MRIKVNFFSSHVFLITAIISCGISFYFMDTGHNYREIAAKADKKTIFLGVDGFSRENFEYARTKMGLFKQFKSVADHIAPFPSISDYSWNIIMHSRDVYGPKAAIKYYEGNFYDYRKNALMDDPREYFRRIGAKQLYFTGFFDYYLNPYVESILYVPTEELPKLELKQLYTSIIESGDKPITTAMVASVDALSHTRADSLEYFKNLDSFITDVQSYYASKNIEVEIIMVSDHGQASNFKIGEGPQPLTPFQIRPALDRANLKLTNQLIDDEDVVIPILALGNYMSISFKDLDKREILANQLKEEEWFSHAVYVEKNSTLKTKRIHIIGQEGEAVLTATFEDKMQFNYNIISGNPLEIPEKYIDENLSEEEVFEVTKKTPYPDSLFRLGQMAFEKEALMPDMIVTSKDQFRVSGAFDKMTTMFETHGSLSRRSSIGLVASTSSSRELPAQMRTKDILPILKIDPFKLAKFKNIGYDSISDETLKQILTPNYKGIDTGSQIFDSDRINGIINNSVNYSRYVYDSKSIYSVLNTFRPAIEKLNQVKTSSNAESVGELPGLNTDGVDQLLTTKDIAVLADLVMKYGDIDKVQNDPKFIQLKNKIQNYVDQKQDKNSKDGVKINSVQDAVALAGPYTRAFKKVTMKAYSSTFFLEKALTLPEFPYENDSRDVEFYKNWVQVRDDFASNYDFQIKNKNIPKRLFQEIFNERGFADDISPNLLPSLYNRKNPKLDQVTLVYVPGIYNSIFDNEIFQIGLDSLQNELGVRIIEAPVLSACSSDYNADLLLKYLKTDQDYLKERGRASQKYFILGYSKGGVDTLHALVKDKEFTKDNILGVIAIASPISGSSILNKTDLPIDLVALLGDENIPEVCKNVQKASKSITPEGAKQFLNANLKDLVGLTRYYSLSFKSDIKNSHLFMRATKTIAQFGEENDGVVTVSSSKFPDELKAVDLGVVEADHLSGIVANQFPQEAFMQAVYLSLLELDAFNPNVNNKVNDAIKYNSPLLDSKYHLAFVSNLFAGDKNKVNSLLENMNTLSAKDKEAKLNEIKDIVNNRIKETPYAIDDFKLDITKNGKVKIVFAKPLEDRRYYVFWETKNEIEVGDVDQIVKVLLSNLQKTHRNLLQDNIEIWRTYPVSDRSKFKMPNNTLGFDLDFRLNLRSLDKYIEGKEVTPMDLASYPKGIDIIYDQRRAVDFRQEYQFNYESTSPLTPDESDNGGWKTILDSKNNLMAKLASDSNSIRLTTYSMRFLPAEFNKFGLSIQVNKTVSGANVAFGGSGKDDSAFQVWFSLREINSGTNRKKLSASEKMYLFGYYFGDPINGVDVTTGSIIENYYSKKNFIVAVLPEAKQIPIAVSPNDLKKPLEIERNFLTDLQRAFPQVDANNLEVVGITIQHDSNDTKSSSETFFKKLYFRP